MALRAVLFDFDGTTVAEGSSTAQPDMTKLIDALHARGIRVGLMSGRPMADVQQRAADAGIDHDGIVSASDVGAKKGGGYLVQAFCAMHFLQVHEALVVADDEWAFREAINGRAFCFHATWGGSPCKYGLRVDAPVEVYEYIDIFFSKTELWYATYTGVDHLGRRINFRGLIDGNGAGSYAVKSAIIQTLKQRVDTDVYGVSLSKILVMHLLSSMYLEGFLSVDRNQVIWNIYPGHSPLSPIAPVIEATLAGFKNFRGKVGSITRWSLAKQSSTARAAGNPEGITFANQASSIFLPAKKGVNLYGSRTFALDDFSTDGYSLEAARNFLDAAGVGSVDLFAFGKYGTRTHLVSAKHGVVINPREQKQYSDSDFDLTRVNVVLNNAALGEFLQSLPKLANAAIAPKLLESN